MGKKANKGKKTNRSATKPDKLKWVTERKATELILSGYKCIDTFHSDRYGKTLFGFKETPKLIETLKKIQ